MSPVDEILDLTIDYEDDWWDYPELFTGYGDMPLNDMWRTDGCDDD